MTATTHSDPATGVIMCRRCGRARQFDNRLRMEHWRRVHIRGCNPSDDLQPGSKPHRKTSRTPSDGPRKRGGQIGLRGVPFTPDEDTILIERSIDDALTALPHRTRETIRRRRLLLASRGAVMQHEDRARGAWTPEEDAILRAASSLAAARAALPHRTSHAVRNRLERLGGRKTSHKKAA